jgi:hypothetical protein
MTDIVTKSVPLIVAIHRECYLCLELWCRTREEINGAKLDREDEF